MDALFAIATENEYLSYFLPAYDGGIHFCLSIAGIFDIR